MKALASLKPIHLMTSFGTKKTSEAPVVKTEEKAPAKKTEAKKTVAKKAPAKKKAE